LTGSKTKVWGVVFFCAFDLLEVAGLGKGQGEVETGAGDLEDVFAHDFVHPTI